MISGGVPAWVSVSSDPSIECCSVSVRRHGGDLFDVARQSGQIKVVRQRERQMTFMESNSRILSLNSGPVPNETNMRSVCEVNPARPLRDPESTVRTQRRNLGNN